MKIGIDLRALQTGHRFRGIGEVAKQVTNRILRLASKNNDTFVFYEYDDDFDPKSLLDITDDIVYEVVRQGVMPEGGRTESTKEKIARGWRQLFGEPIIGSRKCDVFLQFDYAFGVPSNVPSLVIKHDFIPYVFRSQFFESAWVPFRNKAARTTIRTIWANYRFSRILKRSMRRASNIIAVSKSTRSDIKKFIGPKAYKKSKVVHLGVAKIPSKTGAEEELVNSPTKPYLIFIGAADQRRRVQDLVYAYNNLRADGYDIQLVLAGENFASSDAIPNTTVRKEVQGSSYAKDILTVGYISDEQKYDLLRNAIAFVYPTSYEGFGIPILEAMLVNCPVITYKNSSIPEVGGNYVMYADNWEDIKKQAEAILSTTNSAQRDKESMEAYEYAKKFTWEKTARAIFKELISL